MMVATSPRLPLYLRSSASKNINVGSLVVNPNLDFKLYKVLLISKKHILVIDEDLVLYKFKLRNFVAVNYRFNINIDILKTQEIKNIRLNVSEKFFNTLSNLIDSQKYVEILDSNDVYNIQNTIIKVNTKIIVTTTKNSHITDSKEDNVCMLDHYATIKLKNSEEQIYFSLFRDFYR
jgi:hypothetical protein